MAKAQYSGIGVSALSGAYDTIIYSRNRYGYYQKERVPVSNPNTGIQQVIRGAMRDITAIWQSMPQSNRDEWNRVADRKTYKGKLVPSHRLSGFNLFMSQCFNIVLANGSPSFLPVAPSIKPILGPPGFDLLTPADMVVSLTMANGSPIVPANHSVILFASGSISSGINVWRSGYSGFYSFNAGDNMTSQNVYGQYTSVFPAPISGKKIFLRARAYESVSGLSSVYSYLSGIVL